MSVSVFIDSCLLEFGGLLVDWASLLQGTALSLGTVTCPASDVHRVPKPRSLCSTSDLRSWRVLGVPSAPCPNPNLTASPPGQHPMALSSIWMKSTVIHHIRVLLGASQTPLSHSLSVIINYQMWPLHPLSSPCIPFHSQF